MVRLMSKPKKRNVGSNRPATKGDIEQLREDFQADLVNHTYPKEEWDAKLGEVVTKEEFDRRIGELEAKREQDKQEILQELSGKTDQSKQEIIQELNAKTDRDKQEIIHEFRVSVEQQKSDLEGAHQDELAAVEGKKDAPEKWKSMPRRLKAVEVDVEKIKDHLEIS